MSGKTSKSLRIAPKDTYTESIRQFLKAEITALLGETVAATCRRCLDPSLAFIDGQSVVRKSFVSTCEVLETILIPMLEFGDQYLPKEKKTRQRLEGIIFDNINYLVSEFRAFTKRGKVLAPGDPYLNDTGDRQKEKSTGWPYIEANAFLISIILHFLLNKSFFSDVPDDLSKESLGIVAGEALDQIMEQFIPQEGWSHSTKRFKSQIYFTWSVTETLVELLEQSTDGKIDLIGTERSEKLRNQLGEVRGSMEIFLFHRANDGGQFIFTPQLIGSNSRPIYNALQAFITLGVLGTAAYVEMAQTLISLVANSHLIASKQIFETNYQVEHEKVDTARLEDTSILPLIVRAIATVFGEYSSKEFHDTTEKARLRNPWSYMVMADRIGELKKKRTSAKLWGPEGSYEIYYTERVIEALVSCYSYVISANKPAHDLRLPEVDIKKFEAFKENLSRLEKVRPEARI